MNFCARCGKAIAGIHIIGDDGLRYHRGCRPQTDEQRAEVASRQIARKQRKTTQTFEDIQALLSMINEPPTLIVPREP